MDHSGFEFCEKFQDKQGIECRVYRPRSSRLGSDSQIYEFERELRHPSDNPMKRVVLDFSEVTFLSPTPLEYIARLFNSSEELKKPFPRVIGVKPSIYEVFRMVRLPEQGDGEGITQESLDQYRERVAA